MNKTDWTDKLRDRLENYEAPAGGDLWADIEQSLVHRPAVLRPLGAKPARRMGLRWWGMAAAPGCPRGGRQLCVFTATSFACRYGSSVFCDEPSGALSSGSSKDDAHGNAAENQIAALDTDASLSAAQSGQPVLLADNIVDNSRAARKSQGNETSEPLLLSADGGEEPVCDLSPALTESASSAARSAQESSASREISSSSSSSESHQKKHAALSGSQTRKAVRPVSLSTADPQIVAAKSAASEGWSVKLYAENGIPRSYSNGESSGSWVMSDAMMGPAVDNTLQFMVVKLNNKESLIDSKHHFPVSVGLQVGVPLLPRLSLTTGVVYTQTSSDFTYQYGSGQMVVNQSLHYVGIPVALSYEVWGSSRLHTYVNVGGEGAVNVKNKTLMDGNREDVGARQDAMVCQCIPGHSV